jgi:hypothetical protein
MRPGFNVQTRHETELDLQTFFGDIPGTACHLEGLLGNTNTRIFDRII